MPISKNVNSTFFLGWNKPMAYTLGYFVADGCMIKNKRGSHFIEFTSKDKELLEMVQRLMVSGHRISIRNKFNLKQEINYRLQIGSKSIFEDLISLVLLSLKVTA